MAGRVCHGPRPPAMAALQWRSHRDLRLLGRACYPRAVQDEKGTVLAGRYQLVEKSGQGGMAIVWRAVTRGVAGFIRPVAVKRILASLSHNQEFVQMFVEEARVGATLDHPNVVQLHDFGMDEWSNHYLVMEWVEGVDLGRWSESYADAGWHAPWHLRLKSCCSTNPPRHLISAIRRSCSRHWGACRWNAV